MKDNVRTSHTISWIFGIAVFVIGLLNMFLVHPVPGVIYLLLSFIYFPCGKYHSQERFAVKIPLAVKIILGIVIIWFTLGVSDLGDMLD